MSFERDYLTAATDEDFNREYAKAKVMTYVMNWFDKQQRMSLHDPSSYQDASVDDWELWFWESGGEL